jgi:hypothetical protein
MNRKLAILTVLGALVALAVPASSMANTTLSPAGAKFEFVGNSEGPRFFTALGSCTVKFTGQVPAAPNNVSATSVNFAIPTPTIGSCTSGTTVTVGGEWKMTATAPYGLTIASTGTGAGIRMQFSSLPGCILSSGASALLNGIWSNGSATPTLLKSGFHPHSKRAATWVNTGSGCALAGQTEMISWEHVSSSPTSESGLAAEVNNLTTPSAPILLTR